MPNGQAKNCRRNRNGKRLRRGTRKRRMPIRNGNDGSLGGNTAGNNANIGSAHATNVGQKAASASAYGVVDMAGNVAEWVADNYQPYLGNQKADPDFGATNRVVRGGHFRSPSNEIRTTIRGYHSPIYSDAELQQGAWLVGFRCAARADSPKVKEVLQQK